MDLYSVKVGDRRIGWAGTQAEARAAQKAEQAKHADPVIWVSEQVPTDKPGLLAWLRANTLGEPQAVSSKTTASPKPPKK